VDVEKDVVEKLMKSGIPFLNFLYVTDNNTEKLEDREQEYIKVIKNLPADVSQIIIHTGFENAELKKIMDNSASRQYDFSVFTENKIKETIDELGINLISWKDLRELE